MSEIIRELFVLQKSILLIILYIKSQNRIKLLYKLWFLTVNDLMFEKMQYENDKQIPSKIHIQKSLIVRIHAYKVGIQ